MSPLGTWWVTNHDAIAVTDRSPRSPPRDTGTVTDVHQCPYCELRFISRNELIDHIAEAHPRADDDDTITPPTPGPGAG